MRKFQDLEHKLKDKPHPFRVMRPDHVISPTFVVNGKQHWQLHDTFNAPCQRMMSAVNVLDEWQKRMTHEMNREFVNAMKAALNNPKGIVVSDLAVLINNMGERLEWVLPTEDIMIKMASVIHFDESESPYDYDDKYNNEVKIPAWKKAGVNTFFLCEHLKKPMSLPDISQDVLVGAMKVIAEMDLMHKNKLKKVLQKAS